MRRFVLALLLVPSVASVALAEPKLSEAEQQRIRATLETMRDKKIQKLEGEILALKRARRGKQVLELRKTLEQLQKGEIMSTPIIWPQITVGEFGTVGETVEVLNIINGSEMLVVVDADDFDDRQFLWLRGYNTDGITTGLKFRLKRDVYASGTMKYTTAIGGSKTVVVLEPIDLGEFAPKPVAVAKKK